MASQEDITTFIQRHQALLEKERDAEIEQSALLLSNCPPKLLEQKGLALVNLGVANIRIGLGGRSMITLERPAMYHSTVQLPEHSFRSGDIARIEAHSEAGGGGGKSASARRSKAKQASLSAAQPPQEGAQVEGVVYKVSDLQIVLAVDEGHSSNELSLPQRCRLVKLVNMATYDRMEKTMDIVRQMYSADGDGKTKIPPNVSQNALSNVLLGVSRPSTPLPQPLDLEFYNPRLNDGQKDAVRFALGSVEVACIHGPPGTGKTHTLVEIIRQLIFGPPRASTPSSQSPKLKLLVCGASNLSVDNILERILALPKDAHAAIKCTRIGHPARVMSTDAVLGETLDAQVGRSEAAELARDVKRELEQTLAVLTGKAKPQKLQTGDAPVSRKKMWENVRELRKEYRKRERVSVQSITKEAEIIFSTCHSAGGKLLSDVMFDVVIIDEATQALEAVCWVPILKGKKLILAGDPMQLPPTIISRKSRGGEGKTVGGGGIERSKGRFAQDKETKRGKGEDKESIEPAVADTAKPKEPSKQKQVLPFPDSLELTLFERLEKMFGNGIKRMLQVQYRMHASICAYPSTSLYDSKLVSDASVASHLLLDLVDAHRRSLPEYGDILGAPVVFFDTSGCEYFEKSAAGSGGGDEGSKYNENEATVVRMWLESLAAMGIKVSQVAIITPYQAQVSYLSNVLRPTFGPELEIGTVDGMQGREKEAVILSLVRSNQDREVGFLKDTRRLNVAMTRARRQLCVVGDASTVKNGGAYLKNWIAWLEANADVRFGGLE